MKGEFNLAQFKRLTVSGANGHISKELDRLRKFVKRV